MSARLGGVVKILVALALPAALLFGGAGRWDWPAAWVYLALMIGGGAAALRIMARFQPGLLIERTRRRRDGKSWDKPFVPILTVLGPSTVQLICALDKRFSWSTPPSRVVQLAGVAAFAAGAAMTAWAIAVNPFFSAVVRIQADRGHSAIASGPYAHVRHPGYVGMLLCTLATPVVLGTSWGLVPAILLSGVIVARTALEDRTLREELIGYRAYANRVRYRLMPRLW